MRDHTSKLLLAAIGLLPVLLLSGSALLGSAVPLEGSSVSDFDFLENSENEVVVVFFGYVGCSYICPTSLFKIGDVVDEVKVEYPDSKLGGLFVDVNAETQIKRANEYSLGFSSSFKGVNVDQQTIKNLRSEFGLNVIDTNREIDEIIHTDHFFVLKKEQDKWSIARILANNTDQITIKNAIRQELE